MSSHKKAKGTSTYQVTHPPGREGLTKSVIIVSSEGGRGLTKVSPDIEREMGWGKKKKKKKIDDDDDDDDEEEKLELEEEK